MTVTHAVEREKGQSGGGRQVKFRMTRTETGAQWVTNWRRLDPGDDVDAVGAALAPRSEATQLQQERSEAWEFTIAGGDLDTFKGGTPDFQTLAQLQTWFFRTLFNLMREEGKPDREEQDRVCRAMALPRSYMNKHPSPVIVGFVDDPAWRNRTVNSATGKISSAGNALAQLDHGEAELDTDSI